MYKRQEIYCVVWCLKNCFQIWTGPTLSLYDPLKINHYKKMDSVPCDLGVWLFIVKSQSDELSLMLYRYSSLLELTALLTFHFCSFLFLFRSCLPSNDGILLILHFASVLLIVAFFLSYWRLNFCSFQWIFVWGGNMHKWFLFDWKLFWSCGNGKMSSGFIEGCDFGLAISHKDPSAFIPPPIVGY